MSAYKIAAVLFLVMFVAYFAEISGLIRAVRPLQVWAHIGAPDVSSPNGQARLFALIFGRNIEAYSMLPGRLQAKCRRIRAYTVVGIISFLVLAFLLLKES